MGEYKVECRQYVVGHTQLDMVRVVGNVLNGRMHAVEKRTDKDESKMVKKDIKV